MEKIRLPELLAPAGSPESFYASVKAGADAVYLAGKSFGARAYAENFTTDDLIGCFSYAHFYGKKVYLTVNTLVKQSEMPELEPFLEPLVEGGLDGVIVQDLGVLRRIRELYPDLPLHASTQMSVTGGYGARLLKQEGVCRIVPARELSLEEIRALKEESSMELECFIHGAMCYSYSGQCLMSSLYGGRSGNRGRCAQPCRLPYETAEGYLSGSGSPVEKQDSSHQKPKTPTHPLSLKDLCTIDLLPDLVGAGIDSFKIEGRMKAPEYSAGVTNLYRKALDRLAEGADRQDLLTKKERTILETLYVRSDLGDGYYRRRNGREMITAEKPGYNGASDTVLEEIRSRFILPEYTEYAPAKEVLWKAEFVTGSPAHLQVCLKEDPELQSQAMGEVVEPASKRPISRENITEQLQKLGGTGFVCAKGSEPELQLSEDAFYSLKGIGELRRSAIAALTKVVQAACETCQTDKSTANRETRFHSGKSSVRETSGERISILVSSLSQLKAVLEVFHGSEATGDRRIYVEESLWMSRTEEIKDLIQEKASSCEIFLALSRIRRRSGSRSVPDFYDAIRGYLRPEGSADGAPGITGFLVRNPEDLGWLWESGLADHFRIIADASLYAWNHDAAEFLLGYAEELTAPLELSERELGSLKAVTGCTFERVVYGRPCLMVSAGCVARTFGRPCPAGDGREPVYLMLKDRKAVRFPAEIDCVHCMNRIFNSVPLSLHREKEPVKRLEFTTENGRETQEILRFHMFGGEIPYGDYTTGWEKRPVE